MFGRKKRDAGGEEPIGDATAEDGELGFVDDLDAEDRAREDAELLAELDAPERREAPRPQGPWDLADAPEGERLDLGALQLGVRADVEVRMEVDPQGQLQLALAHNDSIAQVNVFAAPRTEGIWAEVRGEIAEALTGAGGQATEAEGVLGTELRAVIPQEVPGRGVVPTPARFVGVDGPRWFVRALLTGPAATQDAAARPLVEALREVVVVRGDDPMPAREPLPLVLPAEAQQQMEQQAEEQQAEEQQAEEQRLAMPERGPEITEVR